MKQFLMVHFVIFLMLSVVCHFSVGKSTCQTKKNLFIQSVTQFKYCEMQQSVPATICIGCIKEYLNVLRSYLELNITTDAKMDYVTCVAELSNQNRLNIIPNEFSSINKLWNDAYCTSCYTDCRPETLPSECIPSAQYIRYNESHNAFSDCIAKSSLNNRSPCEQCLDEYKNQSITYNTIWNGNDKICIDIEDNMKIVRNYWQTSLKCKSGPFPGPTPAVSSNIVPIILILVIAGAIAAGLVAVLRRRQSQLDYTHTGDNNGRDSSNIFTSGRLMDVFRRNSDL